jgi:DNA polymerase-1
MPRPRTVHLVDGSGQFHRAYHAIRGLATSRGLPTNATYGFTTMLRKLLQDEQPDHVAVLFDLPGRTFRHEQYAEYKANRPAMESDLAVQLPYIRRVCEAFRLPIVEVPGFEADDAIATLADQAVAAGFRVVVVTADKDLLQLVKDEVLVLNPGREGTGATLLDRKAVEEKWGVPPERVVDVLALVGDSVDNVPGVPGIGDKGARDLVREFGPVEEVIANAGKLKRAAYRDGLQNHAADALLSKKLVTLRRDVPVSLDLDAIVRREPDRAACHALFKELEFQALAKEYAPETPAGAGEHRLLLDRPSLEAAVAEARAAGRVAIGAVVTGDHAMRARLLGVALSWSEGRSVYVPLEHAGLEAQGALPASDALALMRPLLEDAAVGKASAHSKRDMVVLGRHGVSLAGVRFDALLVSYLLDPGRRNYALEDLAFEHLGERRPAVGDGTAAADAPATAAASMAGAEAELVLRRWRRGWARKASSRSTRRWSSLSSSSSPPWSRRGSRSTSPACAR